ncbi:SusD/RagB family nutrient-binding outer membrane lipoprotein [Sphingobacterium sp. lm-10]|uniref:SusD/RagB family nutrient-binding outer membrane lipoprotein n=1 Tax=Sphingobacterium sp. lm-10 TaxID=2944904 RepID=UPI0020228BE2|nr:SusD/RagB family nutrient-binding outer membrane lipoprotein [Sphingobacterium sp. lm-10]MCL7987972.1 SusD/RagB family nutrient-binding outer membrane lipoprotein [Sphingobacterium sp. lm-10]
MKIIKHNIFKLSIVALALSATSCNKFLDVNDTPNNPLEVPAATLLPVGLSGTAFANSNELNRFASTIMSVTAGVSGSPAGYDIYEVFGDDFGNQWNFEIYGGALINYKKMLEEAEKANSPVYAGVGKIMMAFTFAMATDAWGNVPYSEALLGDMELTSPRLDSQQDIYLGNEAQGIQSLFDLIREGLEDLDGESILTIGSDDIVYGGDLAKWKRAGNSLMLRLAMQISSVEPQIATQVIQEVMNRNMYINANDQNLAVRFGGQVGSQAPLWTLTRNSSFQNELLISTRFVNKLQTLNDPRLPLFVTRPTGQYVTIDNGFRGTPPAVAGRSVYNSYAIGIGGEGPVRLLTNAQTAFILAEAVVRLGVAGNASELYQRGIRASMQDAGVASADIDAYFTANPTVVTLTGTSDQQIEQIINQKYISLFSNGLEQWNDWRRTGYPTLADHQNAQGIDGTRPVRLIYLFTEQQRNPNFPQGDNAPQSNVPVWWDIN